MAASILVKTHLYMNRFLGLTEREGGIWRALVHGCAFFIILILPLFFLIPIQAVGQMNALATAEEVLAERQRLNSTVFAMEEKAQEHEKKLVQIWDALLAVDRSGEGDKFEVLERLIPVETFELPAIREVEKLDHGIEQIFLERRTPAVRVNWGDWLQRMRDEGYQLAQSEWHHQKFELENKDGKARSEVTIALHLTKEPELQRLVIEGAVKVVWSHQLDEDGVPIPEQFDVSGLRILRRTGAPAFSKWLTFDPSSKAGKPLGIHPLLLQDFDGDGLTEIFSGGSNAVFEFDGADSLKGRLLLRHWEQPHEAGIVADFNGDTFSDYITASKEGDLLVYWGNEQGSFPDPPSGRTEGGGPLRQPTAVTAGDIDQDGDLDLWVGQYRISYLMGTMPSPYYDAVDGFPSYLLENQGGGKFVPREIPGFAKKRNRRTYTGSFVDLDDDQDLDLLVVSDFAGIDAYENDGKGNFTDVTDTWFDERHLFGMSATFADYNMDGKLDFFVAGMGSTTARRLEFMKAERKDSPDVERMRMRMAYGNRMYLQNHAGATKGFAEPTFKDSVARTGWTWGTTSLDFDNDGDKDIFVANGHSSGESTKDHCTHFWCHDIYNPSIKPNRALHEAFQIVHQGYFDKSESWDGYQKSNLLMNIGGVDFRNVAFLMGVADQFDGRAALSDDFDGDGRMDLAVVEDRWRSGQILHVYRNEMKNSHHWIGIRLKDTKDYGSPLGAKITVDSGGSTQVASIVSGETIHGQHSSVAHFGLGENSKVDSVEVTWCNGKRLRIQSPSVDKYHRLPQ